MIKISCYLLILNGLFLLFPTLVVGADPKPISFSVNENGEVFGLLEDGTDFSQVNIISDFRMQKFTWDGGSWYITDKGIIEAKTDLQAISIYLTY